MYATAFTKQSNSLEHIIRAHANALCASEPNRRHQNTTLFAQSLERRTTSTKRRMRSSHLVKEFNLNLQPPPRAK
eukprot:6204775-Pleurochrysis_carterae.AAC.6